MAANDDEERNLTALYSQRQELLKDLTEVDNQIKSLEHKQTLRLQAQHQQRVAALSVSSGDKDLDSIRQTLERAIQDQNGLRDAQKTVEAACRVDRVDGETDEEFLTRIKYRNLFIQEIIKRAAEMMIDPHGNYFMQRAIALFKNGGSRAPTADEHEGDIRSIDEISEIVALMEQLGGGLGEICCNMHGTRAVQRLIDSLSSVEEFEMFCDYVANDLVALIKDLNGNHSISRLLVSQAFMKLGEPGEPGAPIDESLREKGQSVRKDIYHIVASNCVEICRNRQGCCIIQRCLQWAPEPFRTEIINAALLNSLKLVQDPFGNYVVQYILDLQQQLSQHNPQEAETLNYTNRIIRQILHNVALLSCNKFSSNVIEKCLKSSSPDVRQLLIDELTDPHALPKLLTDSFANYVIQTAITAATDDTQFAQLRDAILPLQHLLKNSPYGIKIEAKLLKRHRDSAKKLNRQMRAQRETQRGPSGQEGNGSQRQSNAQHQQQQQQQGPPHVDPAVPQMQFVQQQQVIRISNPPPPFQPMPTLQNQRGPVEHQQHLIHQSAQPFQQQQFVMPPTVIGTLPTHQQHSSQQPQHVQVNNNGQQPLMMAMQQGGNTSWAVSSQGYTAVQQQQQQQQNSQAQQRVNLKMVPGPQPTHTPYTSYNATF